MDWFISIKYIIRVVPTISPVEDSPVFEYTSRSGYDLVDSTPEVKITSPVVDLIVPPALRLCIRTDISTVPVVGSVCFISTVRSINLKKKHCLGLESA